MAFFVALPLATGPGASAVADPAGTVAISANGAPETIPALSHWTPSSKASFAWSRSSRVVAASGATVAVAGTLASALSERRGRHVAAGTGTPRTGDIAVVVDPSRSADLGDEGYELVVGKTISVTGAHEAGAFYGAQTVIQILTRGGTVPAGSSIDIPAYRERGVGICACQIQVSLDFFHHLMKDMAYLKLNQLWIETKVESAAYDKANFWGYYTKAEAKQLNAWAKKYHIELVPEVNSPGHMTPWLSQYPELQLTDAKGVKQPSRLDITQPQALKLVTTLVDEYFDVFDTRYWHMGADEYMLGSDFAAYPQFAAYMAAHPEEFAPDAVPQDVFVDFINEVAKHVEAKGKTLRVWNDGIPKNATHQLDPKVVVEYWDGREAMVQADEVLKRGYDLMNASYSLYLIRGDGGNPIQEETLWNKGWTVRNIDGLSGDRQVQDVPGGGSVIGAKVTAWPDTATGDTENQVADQLFASTRFIAQATWATERPVTTYAQFAALSARLGRAPAYQTDPSRPLADGTYRLNTGSGASLVLDGLTNHVVTARANQPWTLAATDDGYYRISTSDSKCLSMRGGTLWLNAPIDSGLAVSAAPCVGDNLEKWWVRATHGGYQLVNAITQMPLTLENAAGQPSSRAGSVLVQRPPDVVAPVVLALLGSH